MKEFSEYFNKQFDKFLSYLRTNCKISLTLDRQLFNNYIRSDDVEDYVNVIKDEDLCYHIGLEGTAGSENLMTFYVFKDIFDKASSFDSFELVCLNTYGFSATSFFIQEKHVGESVLENI